MQTGQADDLRAQALLGHTSKARGLLGSSMQLQGLDTMILVGLFHSGDSMILTLGCALVCAGKGSLLMVECGISLWEQEAQDISGKCLYGAW